jgi:hypothetical protein
MVHPISVSAELKIISRKLKHIWESFLISDFLRVHEAGFLFLFSLFLPFPDRYTPDAIIQNTSTQKKHNISQKFLPPSSIDYGFPIMIPSDKASYYYL